MKKNIGASAISFPAPVYIIGSYCKDGKPNVMNVAWGGLCSSEPPCIAISIRKNRCTYDNIIDRGAFTVNIPSEQYMIEADYFGMASGHKADKFAVSKLDAVKSPNVDAPYIEQFPICLECKLVKSSEIGQHEHFIGQIVNVMVDADCLNEADQPDAAKVKPMIYDPVTNNYNAIGKVLGKAFSAGRKYLK